MAGGVPNLQFDALPVHLDVLNFKVYPDGRNEGGGEGVVGVSEEQASFADAGVADHEQFALHVVGGCLGHDADGCCCCWLTLSVMLGLKGGGRVLLPCCITNDLLS